MAWIFDTFTFLIGLGLVLFVVAAFFAPFESMQWWAGWSKHGLEPDIDTSKLPAPLPQANPNAEHYLVYLTGIGGFSGDYLAAREVEFLERMQAKMGDKLVIVNDVFPFAVGNNPLNGERLFSKIWDWIHARQKINNMDVTTFFITARNALQVAVSGDPRYGPMNNFGIAHEVSRSLLRHGYQPGSGKPITLVGYSGGGQISVGITRYMHLAFDVPVRIITLGGVMSDDPGFEMVDHLYQLIGGKDWFPAAGVILFPRRWPGMPFSYWNKIKRDGRVTTIHPGQLVYHVGGEDYFSNVGKLPNGQTFMEKTIEIVSDVIAGKTDKYRNGSRE